VVEFQSKAGSLLLSYALITVVALIFDIIVIFIGLGSLDHTDDASFSTVFVFILGVVYFFIAFYFIGWAIAVRQRLPKYA